MNANENDETPKPGSILLPVQAKSLIGRFRLEFSSYLNPNMNADVPLACRLEGIAVKGDFVDLPITKETKVYAYFENVGEVYYTTFGAVTKFLKERQPWEDYDICIFDSTLLWCFCISHEDKYSFVKALH